MPIDSSSGKTYVAFSDLNGFKEIMRNHQKAANALDKLYKTVYTLKTRPEYSSVQTLAISDCAISFIRNVRNENNREKLPLMLSFIKELHVEMIQEEYLITSSVAYGNFSYQERIEITGLEKNMLYGDAYLNAYLNNAKYPNGSIVIVCDENGKRDILQCAGKYKEFLRDNRRSVGGFQFYWAVSSPEKIIEFEAAYIDTYRLKYKGMISVYKEYSGQ